MPTNDDSIEYRGNVGKYAPGPGGRDEAIHAPDSLQPTAIIPFVSRVQEVLTLLQLMVDEGTQNANELQGVLNQVALPIRDDPADAQLAAANEVEWPVALGQPRPSITYQYYKALQFNDSSSARYIRRRYEEALRDVAGTSALDLLKLQRTMIDEQDLVKNFINDHLRQGDDTSEFKAVGLFLQWAKAALQYTRNIRAVFERGENPQILPETEIDGVSTTDAKKAQAVFKVKLNSVNDHIARIFDDYAKNFSEHAEVFFKQFFGPALDFRLDVSRKIYPVGSLLGRELTNVGAALDTNLEEVLADQLRRNRIFITKINEIMALIDTRDTYRGYIKQLSMKGNSVPSGAEPGALSSGGDSPEEIEAFDQLALSAQDSASSRNQFSSPHAALAGREFNDHPQYLLRGGGNVYGDVTLNPGTKIDNIDPDQHRHTGKDGSAKISLADLISNLGTNGDPATTPTDLRVIDQRTRTSPSGVTVVDVTLGWLPPLGGGNFTYELNVAPILE